MQQAVLKWIKVTPEGMKYLSLETGLGLLGTCLRDVEKGSADVFCKGPGRYFGLCRPARLCHSCSTLPWKLQATLDNIYMNECGCKPIKLYL